MPGKTVKIRASEGGTFDCYVALPEGSGPTPAMVLACAISGVDQDHMDMADAFAAKGFIAAAPDLFWRTIPGPLPASDERRSGRGQPRGEKIATGEADMVDTLAYLRTLPQFNGRAATIGYCYGGPYAITGPKRLGYDAGLSCHGTRMQDYLPDLDGVTQPVSIMWGDKDHAAPAEVLDAYRPVPGRMKNVEVHIFPGVLHGYMLRSGQGFDAKAYEFSMGRALAILEGLRGASAGKVRAAE
jgi:carboxymethylenebutenolidase